MAAHGSVMNVRWVMSLLLLYVECIDLVSSQKTTVPLDPRNIRDFETLLDAVICNLFRCHDSFMVLS